jgi:hypothetical protein
MRNFYAEVGSGVYQPLRSFCGLPNIADALVGEVDENNVGGHCHLSDRLNKKAGPPLRKPQKQPACIILYPVATIAVGASVRPQIQKPIKVGKTFDRYLPTETQYQGEGRLSR